MFLADYQAMLETPDDPPAKAEQQIVLATNIDRAIRESDVSPNRIADACGGISVQSVSNWRRSGKITKENLLILAGLVNWTLEELQRPGGKANDSDDVFERVEMPKRGMEGIPVVGSVRGGPDGYYAELEHAVGQGEGFIRYPTRDPGTYALRVKGDSMRPRIRPGEFIVVSPNSQPIVGDEAVIKTRDGRVMVKLYQAPRNGQIELHSINHDHKPITLETSEIEYIHHILIIAKADTYYPSVGL